MVVATGSGYFLKQEGGFRILPMRVGTEPTWRLLPKEAFSKGQSALPGGFVPKNLSNVG